MPRRSACPTWATAALVLLFADCGCEGRRAPLPSLGSDRPPLAPSYPANELTFALGLPIVPPVLPEPQPVTAGWSVQPDLPAGLALDRRTGAIAGTPQQLTPPTRHVITAANPFGRASAELTITVTLPVARLVFAAGGGERPVLAAYAVTGSARAPLSLQSLVELPGLPLAVAAPANARRVHVATTGDGARPPAVLAFAVDGDSGQLVRVATTPLPAPAADLALDPAGTFLYAVLAGGAEVRRWRVDAATGALRDEAVARTGVDPRRIVLAADGRFAWVLAATTEDVWTYAVDPASGALLEVAAARTGTAPRALAIDERHGRAFVANEGTRDVSVYAIDADLGTLTELGRVPAGIAAPLDVGVDPRGELLYVLHEGGVVRVHRLDGGTAALEAVQQVAVGGEPFALRVAADAVWVLRREQPSLLRLGRERDGGMLGAPAAEPFTGEASALALGLGATPVREEVVAVHVLHEGSGELLAFTARLPDVLQPLGVRLAFAGAAGMAVHPSRRFAFLSTPTGPVAVGLDDRGGLLPPVLDAERRLWQHVGGAAAPIASSASGELLFAALPHALGVFAVDGASGAVAERERLPLARTPLALTLDASGTRLLVLQDGTGPELAGSLQSFRLDPSRAAVQLAGASEAPVGAVAMATSPRGDAVWVASASGQQIAAWQVGAGGELHALATATSAGGPVALASLPDGEHLLVLERSPPALVLRRLDGRVPSEEVARGTLVGADPVAVRVTADGRFAYVLARGTAELELWAIEREPARLRLWLAAPTAAAPRELSLFTRLR